MSAFFNPYREWLGRDHVSATPDYYDLLDLPYSEADPAAIAEAAERAMRRLRSVRPEAEHLDEWSRILREIRQAQSVLSDPSQKAAYDQQLAGLGERRNGSATAAQPQSFAPAQQAPQARAATVPYARPMNAGQAPMAMPAGYAAPGPAPQPVDPMAPAPYAAPAAPAGMPGPMSASVPMARPVMAAPAPAAPASMSPGMGNAPAPSAPILKGAPGKSAARALRKKRRSGRYLWLVYGLAACLLAGLLGVLYNTFGVSRPANPARPAVAVKDDSTRRDATPPTPAPAQSPPAAPLPLPADIEPVEASDPEEPSEPPFVLPAFPTQEMTDPEAPPGAMPQETAPADSPSNSPPEPDPTPAPSAADLARLGELLKSARAAMSERELDEAEKLLDEAAPLATLPEHEELLKRQRTLLHYAREFWRAVREGLAALAPNQDFKVGNTTTNVVEVTPERLVLRLNGMNRSFPADDLPLGVAEALANSWLAVNDPATFMAQGAFYATKKGARSADLEEARRLWGRAREAGADVSLLLPVLDDTYELTEGGSPSTAAPGPTTAPRAASPMPASAPQAASPPTAEELRRLSETLRSARSALSQRKLDDLGDLLRRADTLSKTPEHQAQTARLRNLAELVEAFWTAVGQGMQSMRPGEVLRLGETQVEVLESNDKLITVQAAGMTMKHARLKLPAGLAMALATKALGSDSSAPLVKGAIYAVEPGADPAAARQHWMAAAEAGADVSGLLESLDDDYAAILSGK